MNMSFRAKDIAKSTLYATGALDLYRRAALSETLTVAMFHRVLPPSDQRYPAADPQYTMKLETFERCLDFFQRRYNVVSLDDVDSAAAGRRHLPKRAMLITLDDGWEDTRRYAAPALAKRRLPSVVFVASDALTSQTVLWQDVAACIWRADPDVHQRTLRAVVDWVNAMPLPERSAWLEAAVDANRQALRPIMMSENDLRSAAEHGMAVGGHGASHTPLTKADDLTSELARCRCDLRQATGKSPTALSFPHGDYSPDVVRAALKAGFTLLFSSDPCLNPTSNRIPGLLGRLDIPEHAIVDERGEFIGEKLAYWLTARPTRRLPMT